MREVRLKKLQQLVLQEGAVEVDPVASELGVSRETIRRDLSVLADRGLVVRTHGGATAPDTSLTEIDLSVRSDEHRQEKSAIAVRAAALVEDGTSIGIDTGTTAVEIARALRGRELTVVTASLPVINELAGSATAVVIIGGVLRARSMGTVGPVAESVARQFHCDVAFISAPAISPEQGVMDTDLDGIAIKQALLGNARRAYAVMDHTKLDRTAFATVCPLDDLTGLVTDSGADPQVLTAFENAGLAVHVAPIMGDS